MRPTGTKSDSQAGNNHEPEWELTFSAPKSVSVFWGVSDAATRAKIETAQFEAVKRAIEWIEAKRADTRRGRADE